MEITNTEVFGLYRAQESAGLPKLREGTPTIPECINKLGRASTGSGHDCFLKGIIVQARIKADHSFWIQWQRYHFQDIVSSSSKMHTILTGDVQFEDGTNGQIITMWNDLRDKCIENNTPENFQRLIMSTPMGMMLTADISTNYLQLKTTYAQRRTHKMASWNTYCDWIEDLPDFLELTQRKHPYDR